MGKGQSAVGNPHELHTPSLTPCSNCLTLSYFVSPPTLLPPYYTREHQTRASCTAPPSLPLPESPPNPPASQCFQTPPPSLQLGQVRCVEENQHDFFSCLLCKALRRARLRAVLRLQSRIFKLSRLVGKNKKKVVAGEPWISHIWSKRGHNKRNNHVDFPTHRSHLCQTQI